MLYVMLYVMLYKQRSFQSSVAYTLHQVLYLLKSLF